MGSHYFFLVLVLVGGLTGTRWLIPLVGWALFAKPGMLIAQLVYRAHALPAALEAIAWAINAFFWVLAVVSFVFQTGWPWMAIIGALAGVFGVGSTVVGFFYRRAIRRGAAA
jgi:hypothetical protein